MAIAEELKVQIEVQAARAVANLAKYQKAAKGATQQTNTFAGVAKKAAAFIGGAAIAGAFLKAAKSSIGFAAAIEKQKASFETLLGTEARATKFFNQIRDFSAATPFALPDLTKGAQRLLAFGTAADDVVTKLEQLGNAAQGDSATLDRLVDAYGKVQARGRASLEDLNRFTEAGVPIMEALGKQVGATGEELFDLVSKGAIGFEEVDAALVQLTTDQGQFAGLLEKQSATLSGLLSTARDNIGLLGAELGDIALPAIKAVVEQVIILAQKFTNFIRENRGTIQAFFENFPEIAKLVFGRVLEIARDAIRFENLRDIIVAIGAGIIRILSRTWDELLTIFIERLKILVEPFRAIGDFVLTTFRAIWDRIRNLGVDAINGIVRKLQESRVGEFFAKQFGVQFQEIERQAEESFPNIGDTFDEAVSNIGTSAGKILAAIKEIGAVGVDELKNVGLDIATIFDDEKAAAFNAELQRLLATTKAIQDETGGGGAGAPETGGGGGAGNRTAEILSQLEIELELAEARAIAFADSTLVASGSVAALEGAINSLVEAGVAPESETITGLRDQLKSFEDQGKDTTTVLKALFRDFWGEQAKTAEDSAARIRASLQGIASQSKAIFSLITDIQDAEAQKRIANMEAELERFQETGNAQIEFAEAAGEDTVALREQLAQQTAEKEAEIEKSRLDLEKKQFERNKKVSIAEAAISGAQAFVKALTAGPIIGPILGGVIAGLAATQISLIAAQKFPGFQGGGEFETTGPTAFVAGEGGRRERVRIDPQPDNRRATGGNVIVQGNAIYGPEGADEFLVAIAEGIDRLKTQGRVGSI